MKVISTLIKVLFVDCRYFIAIGIRIFMIILSEFMLYKYNIVYTDIDYHVFSDASKHLINFESPYNRETYRYTPLLALMMIPNHILNYNVGKVLLSFIDVLVGLLIEILLNIQHKTKFENEKVVYKKGVLLEIYKYIDNPYSCISLLYLYNPITINICTRGSADCIVIFLVILSMIFLEIGFFPFAGIIYGFSIHFKIYPIIYAPALYLYLISKDVHLSKIFNDDKISQIQDQVTYNETTKGKENILVRYYNLCYFLLTKMMSKFFQLSKFILRSVFHYKALIFAFLTISTFLSFLACFYVLYGNKFLYEYLIYHLVRKDHRHNYSVFNYLIYLTYSSNFSKILSMITFLPQVILILFTTLFLFQNINLCILVLTMIFVTFNKVVTAQYFLWYISLLPIIAPFNKLFDYHRHGGKVIVGILLFMVWLFFELIWNSYSHRLEYKGENLFIQIWGINIAFFLTNCLVIKEILVSQKSHLVKL